MNVSGKRLSTGDIAVGAGLIVGFISVFLPWYSASFSGEAGFGGFSTSVGGLSYWSGWFFFLATIIGIALFVLRTFVPTVAVPAMPLDDAMIYLVLGAVMVVMALLWLVAGAPGGSSGPGYSVGISFGLIIGIIAGVAVLVGGFLKRSDPQPTTRPMSSYQTPSAPPPSAPPPPPSV